ncbi:discoidin domain-containing protein [Gelidibacter salicanalis]|uniref:DUF1735 domain-containing protein n=1 Tax=Gelidibacter salicanalis TaxID=291193 RepID=A0A934NJX2_9FLAO|nr:discoidin domain-containing protein [Gelidibacter salicanalis]MBJ7882134.1 DUF1735 domain-containing protein [Gelidibacter salicanalis]
MKKRYLLYTSLIVILGLHSCEKDAIPYEELTDNKEGALIFTSKARGGIKTLQTFSLEEESYLEKDTVMFNAGFGALGLPASNIDVTFSIDTRAFDSINDIRELNGEKLYIPFPSDAYSISTLELTIPKGEEYSNFSTMIYDPEKFDIDNNYLIALSIIDASGYKINPEVKTAIFRVSEVIIPEPEPDYYSKDDWEVIDFSSEESKGEGTNGFASRIIDGDINTFWHSCWSGCTEEQSTYPHHITVDMMTGKEINGMEFAQRQSGSRGINLIEIEVSDDNEAWRSLGEFNLINSVAPQLVAFEELESFRFFRIIIKSGHSDGGAAFVALGEVSPYILD